jgi:hypothetical protein
MRVVLERVTMQSVNLGGRPRRGVFAIGGLLAALAFAALVVGCIALIALLINTSFKSSVVYQEAMQAAQSNPRVIAVLGEPIREGFPIMGSIETAGLSGEADLRIPIRGPEGRGVLQASARRQSGVWVYFTLAVYIPSTGEVIVLQ